MTRKPASFAKALLKISGTMHKVSPKELKHIESCNAFFIIPAISGDPLTQRFSTHPPIEKRIEIFRHGVGYASILMLVRERYETKDEFQFEIVFNIHLTLCSSNENWTRDDYHQKMFGVYCYPLFKI